MANTEDLRMFHKPGQIVEYPVAAGTKIYAHEMVALNASGYLVEATDAASLTFVGISKATYDNTNGDAGDISAKVQVDGCWRFAVGHTITQATVGTRMYVVDGANVDVTAHVSHNLYCGIVTEYVSATSAFINIKPATLLDGLDDHINDTTGAHAASAISFADSGNKTAAIEVDGALDEIYVDLTSAALIIAQLKATDFALTDGTPLAKSAAGGVPGLYGATGQLMLAWTTNAAPAACVAAVPLRASDINTGHDVTITVRGLISSTNDTPTLGVKVTFGSANSDKGGTTAAFGSTVAEKTVTITAANLPTLPATMYITLTPQAGALGTDSMCIEHIAVTGTRKLRTA